MEIVDREVNEADRVIAQLNISRLEVEVSCRLAAVNNPAWIEIRTDVAIGAVIQNELIVS